MVASASVSMADDMSKSDFIPLKLNKKSQQKTPPTLMGLPSELKSEIFKYLPGPSLAALQATHSCLAHEARIVLYDSPNFASTFRLAQFAYTITQYPSYAKLVHKIDLSPLPDYGKIARAEELLAIEQAKQAERKATEARACAQFRKETNMCIQSFSFPSAPFSPQLHHELSGGLFPAEHTEDTAPWALWAPYKCDVRDEVAAPLKPKQPDPDPDQNHYYFDLLNEAIKVPIGFLFHILTSCTNLRQLCISNIGWDTDYHTQSYLRDCNFSQHHWDYLFTFHPRKRSCMEARADVEHLAILREDLLGAVLEMEDLRVLAVEGCKWIPGEKMEKLVEMCEGRGGLVKGLSMNDALGLY